MHVTINATSWIKCSDRLPKDFERKLIFSICDGICTARYSNDYWDLDPKGDYATGGYIPEVTHWAELPEKPYDLV